VTKLYVNDEITRFDGTGKKKVMYGTGVGEENGVKNRGEKNLVKK
jgi:hypothetical protein